MSAKILLLDIETSPLVTYTWGLFDQNIGLNQIKEEWFILAFSAKWYDPTGKVKHPLIYKDQRGNKKIHNDKQMLKEIWNLLDECDILITQNGKSFDIKKINAKFIEEGFKPYSPIRHLDTYRIVKKHFALTSNKLEYLANVLKCEQKKLTKRKFNGFTLWSECLKGNKEAWKEMESYNKRDVEVLEEVYKKVSPWDTSINFNVFSEDEDHVCSCGSKDLKKNGTDKTNSGVFQRWKCTDCGKPYREKLNLLSPEKRKSMKVGVKR